MLYRRLDGVGGVPCLLRDASGREREAPPARRLARPLHGPGTLSSLWLRSKSMYRSLFALVAVLAVGADGHGPLARASSAGFVPVHPPSRQSSGRHQTGRWAHGGADARPSSPPNFPAHDLERDIEDVRELTHRLYKVMNERKPEEFRRLWHDSDDVLFHAGDGNITRGHEAVSDLFRQVRIDEYYVDPGKRGIMLHPTVDISNLRVIVNGIHAWATCQETMTRGLKPGSPAPGQPAIGTNIFRKFNGEWRVVVHWSGRLGLVRDQVDDLMRSRREAGAGGRGRGQSKNNPMMSGWGADDDDDDDGEVVFESWGPLEEDEEDEDALLEQEASEEAERLLQQAAQWERSAALRKKTKKALAAVRRIFKDGRITKQEKRKLIFSVIRSASQDEISMVEQAYDLLVQRDVGGQGESCMEEFADQCRVIATMWN